MVEIKIGETEMSRIDTLKEFIKLKESGIPEQQAIAQVEAMFKMMDLNTEGLATKDDISNLMHETKREILGLAKDIFYMKLMLGGIFAIGALPIIKDYL